MKELNIKLMVCDDEAQVIVQTGHGIVDHDGGILISHVDSGTSMRDLLDMLQEMCDTYQFS